MFSLKSFIFSSADLNISTVVALGDEHIILTGHNTRKEFGNE